MKPKDAITGARVLQWRTRLSRERPELAARDSLRSSLTIAIFVTPFLSGFVWVMEVNLAEDARHPSRDVIYGIVGCFTLLGVALPAIAYLTSWCLVRRHRWVHREAYEEGIRVSRDRFVKYQEIRFWRVVRCTSPGPDLLELHLSHSVRSVLLPSRAKRAKLLQMLRDRCPEYEAMTHTIWIPELVWWDSLILWVGGAWGVLLVLPAWSLADLWGHPSVLTAAIWIALATSWLPGVLYHRVRRERWNPMQRAHAAAHVFFASLVGSLLVIFLGLFVRAL